MKLNSFWAAKGCLIWQPHNQVVGAGTMNPATFLRVLGPEPWNVAYIEPSVRPDDGRFGQNPNRLYTHTQYQVILKPAPERSQELYLESLEAIGVDLSKHDVRFVEDNWAQPAIGAWGLGWEVWLDGLEITQYTYFQQVGSVTLDPICLELTYGLERIAMALQGTRSVFDLKWDATRTYGDAKLQDEIERSQYAFNYADVEDLHELFEIYERECKRTLGYNLVSPAYDYVLQCSNLFNLLDTRGAIGVTERARFLGRIRDLAREVAIKYTEQRAALGHPWLAAQSQTTDDRRPTTDEATVVGRPSSIVQHPTTSALLLELGVEELPADTVPTTQEQLRKLLIDTLAAERIEHGAITMYATPRRIAAVIADVAPQQRALDELMKGPGAKIAFDANGAPTQAAIGFAKRFGVDPTDLIVKEEGNVSYVYARKQEAGKPSGEVLTKVLPGVISKISFEKTMRWNASNVAFSRPINWIVALLGETVIPFEYAGVQSGRNSTGPRGEGSPRFDIKQANDYAAMISQYGIIGDIDARKAEILRQVQAVAASIGGVISEDEDLLEEVTHLVEQPAALLSSFEKEYLDIPAPVLISVLRKKQRNFTVLAPTQPSPVRTGEGQMLPYFITVRNGRATDMDEVRIGNESVVRARFADAAYFVRQDVLQPLEKYLPRLDTITFQGKLGSILDKVKRIEAVIDPLGHQLRLESADLEIARKAAHLCKADLATTMVIDITALQGVMGREYHKRSSDDADKNAVAEAIFEHYLPRNSNDRAPKTKAGLLVGLADKLDSIAGLFAVGLAPKGSNDPFALRRAAIGVVQNLMETGQSFSLREGLKSVAVRLPVKMESTALEQAHTFLTERERVILEEGGNRKDLVEAVLAEQGDNPAQAKAALTQLVAATQSPDWPAMLAAYARCARIVRSATTAIVDSDCAADPDPSTALLAEAVAVLPKPTNVQTLMQNIAALVGPINVFFEKVMVMADDPAIRNVRLALLQRIAGQARGLVDLSKVEGF